MPTQGGVRKDYLRDKYQLNAKRMHADWFKVITWQTANSLYTEPQTRPMSGQENLLKCERQLVWKSGVQFFCLIRKWWLGPFPRW